MKLHINESEKNFILSLYEQETKVDAVKLDTELLNSIPTNMFNVIEKEFRKQFNDSTAQEYIKDNLKFNVDEQNPLSDLIDNGIIPYIFVVPNPLTGRGFPTTGINFKIKETPFNFSLNLGTDPKDIIDAAKWSMIGLNLNF